VIIHDRERAEKVPDEDPELVGVNLMQFAGKMNSKKCLYDILKYDGK
jgi:hypothetical protein